MKFKFYDVDIEYLNYLRQFEPKLPDILYKHHNKFMCGFVFEKNGLPYVVPVSSNMRSQKTSVIIKSKKNRPISSLRFSFMFPCPPEFLKYKDFKEEPDPKYRRWLQDEIGYCNTHREKIRNKAEYTYFHRVIAPKPLFERICCDFALLEEKCLEYCAEKHIPITKPEQEKMNLQDILCMAQQRDAARGIQL